MKFQKNIIAIIFTISIIVSFSVFLYQMQFYLYEGFPSVIIGSIIGGLISFVLIFVFHLLKTTRIKSRFLVQISQILLVALVIVSTVFLLSIMLGEFGFSYVYTRWYTQQEMNGVLLKVSLLESNLITLGFFSIVKFPEFQLPISGQRFSQLIKLIKNIPTILFLSITIINPFLVSNIPVQHDVTERYDWNDGPWLNWNGNPEDSLAISWLTDTKRKTEILFGTNPDSLELISSEIATSKSNLHNLFLDDLNPDTTYYYQIPDVKFPNFPRGKLFNFTTSPVTGNFKDFKFVVVGDMQAWSSSENSAQDLVAEGISKADPDFVCAVGDLGDYGRDLNQWHYLMSFLPQYASDTVFQSVLGNHDWYGDNGSNFRNIFPYDYEEDKGAHYSFNYQNVHFVMLDSVSNNDAMQSRQEAWLENDLNMANDSAAIDWIFVFLHYNPMTTAGGKGYTNILRWLAPVTTKYQVDGVFFGHEHYYEHWDFEYGNQGFVFDESDEELITGETTHYFLTGGGGATLNVGWDITEHETVENDYYFYNLTSDQSEVLSTVSYPWNSSRYLSNQSHLIYGYRQEGPLYYHAPEIESYTPEVNDLFGYDYGEQTTHFMEVEVVNNGNTCIISAKYPNEDLLMGPNDAYPQKWTITK